MFTRNQRIYYTQLIVGLVEILTNLLKSIILMVEYLYKQLLDLLHITFNN